MGRQKEYRCRVPTFRWELDHEGGDEKNSGYLGRLIAIPGRMSETGIWGTSPAGQDMRALIFSAFLLADLVSQATAQLAVGPVAINNNVYGVPIIVSAPSWTTVNSTENGTVVNARIFADFVDFQKKFSS